MRIILIRYHLWAHLFNSRVSYLCYTPSTIKHNAHPQPEASNIFSFFALEINIWFLFKTNESFWKYGLSKDTIREYVFCFVINLKIQNLPPSVDWQCRDARLEKRSKTKENHMLAMHQGFICDNCRAGPQGQWWDSCAGHTVQISQPILWLS